MKPIDRPLNPELQKILYTFSDWFKKQDMSKVYVKGEPDQNDYYTSQEYLQTIDKMNHIGYPEVSYGIDLLQPHHTHPDLRSMIVETNKALNAYLSTKFCAVNMYYPKGGYMGWHNNHNCPGYNILLTHNRDLAGGYFRYIDPITKEEVTIIDKKGWTAKVGYYGHLGEPDKVYWHCARAWLPRLTFGYVVPDKEMWEMMIEDL